jgi:predicted membrane protein
MMKSIAILGGSKLGQRPWRPGKKVWAIAILGGSEVDFRQAELEEDVTQMVAFSLFGGNTIIVPQGMPVTLSGLSILGSREMKRSQAKEPALPSAKALHINAIAILGGVEVTDKAEE